MTLVNLCLPLPKQNETIMEEKNATIESATLNTEDYGCLTSWIHLDYGGSGQGFGGHNLFNPRNKTRNKPTGPVIAYAGHFIYRVMEVAGVGSWDKLKGKTIRVRLENELIHSIGHITKDEWFCPKEEFLKLEEV